MLLRSNFPFNGPDKNSTNPHICFRVNQFTVKHKNPFLTHNYTEYS